MFELIGTVFGALVAVQGATWALLTAALPLAWLWMAIDALTRREADFPSGSSNEKLLWILLIVFQPYTAALYFILVHRARPRTPAANYTQAQSA